MGSHGRRFLAGWAATAGALAAFFGLGGAEWLGCTHASTAWVALACAALIDAVVFFVLVRGIGAAPSMFLRSWAVSLLVKVTGYGVVLASNAGAPDATGFTKSLILSFVVLMHHELFALVRVSSRATVRPQGVTSC